METAELFSKEVDRSVLDDCDLSSRGPDIAERFSSQEKVNRFVQQLEREQVERLTEACSSWRKNDVLSKLKAFSEWSEVQVAIDLIKVQEAEPDLAHLFKKNEFRLDIIARDQEILAAEPYRHYAAGNPVAFPICLALKSNEAYQVFDGIHRAIQLARNGHEHIDICFAIKASRTS
jgi:hypothetical protein